MKEDTMSQRTLRWKGWIVAGTLLFASLPSPAAAAPVRTSRASLTSSAWGWALELWLGSLFPSMPGRAGTAAIPLAASPVFEKDGSTGCGCPPGTSPCYTGPLGTTTEQGGYIDPNGYVHH
jgi:hypothetical protein